MPEYLPEVMFHLRVRDAKPAKNNPNPFHWEVKSTVDLFSKKRVVIFALPGAFTPICSANHLPEYERLASEIKNQGVDEIWCTSVNDAFVMFRWGKSFDPPVENIRMLPDGDGFFAKSMGMLVDKMNLGFGHRSWRYSMLVNDLKIEKIFEEKGKIDNSYFDPFEISDANTMLNYLKKKKKKKAA